jgi:hypothetical protein
MYTTTTLLSKTGQMNMGGYFKEKTARLDYISDFGDYCFRVYYLGDTTDECYSSIDDAIARFNEKAQWIK